MDNWEKKLEDFFQNQKEFEEAHKGKMETDRAAKTEVRKRAEEFTLQVVEPAFRKLAHKLKQHEKKVLIERGDISSVMEVRSKNRTEFIYALDISLGTTMATVHVKYKATNKSGRPLEEGDKTILKDNREADISDITETDIINNFIENYTRTMRMGRMA